MKKVIDFKSNIDQNKLNECGECIRRGGLVIFPTETVYGLGADALESEAVNKIFKAKKRPSDNPLIVHISDFDMLSVACDVSKISKLQKKLIDSFFPGPFTIILQKSDKIPYNVTAGMQTVGVRMPDNIIANRLINASQVPIAAPSANVSGKPSGTCIEDIYDELNSSVDYIIDGGKTQIGIESTVVKVKEDKVIILRPGKITVEDIQKVVGKSNVLLSPQLFKAPNPDQKVESPGMKHRHYAPKCKSILVYSDDQLKQLKQIEQIVQKNIGKYTKICILGFEEDQKYFLEKFKENIQNNIQENAKDRNKKIIFINMGSRYDYLQISSNIFNCLRMLDKISCDFAVIEAVKKQGIGVGIMNRLIRACEYNEIVI